MYYPVLAAQFPAIGSFPAGEVGLPPARLKILVTTARDASGRSPGPAPGDEVWLTQYALNTFSIFCAFLTVTVRRAGAAPSMGVQE